MNRLFVLCACLLTSIAPAVSQRLPDGAVPESYTLRFTPDLPKETFAGEETIHIRVLKPTSQIVVNAADIDFQQVTIASGESKQEAKVTLDKDKEQATFAVERALPAGPASIQVKYNGKLNHELRGFYIGKQDNGDRYAATQFEATDARRAFPCFDEPAYKATFKVTMVADKDLKVISNTKALSDVPGPGDGKHTVTFERTPKMSSYLVAFVVGNFEYIEGSADGIPIRIYTSPGKKDLAKFALETAENALHYYDHYFGIRYPFGKLDMVALSDFGPGAMENTGCITYREAFILLDQKHTDLENRKFIASVVAHEMAHQWFGDLVTMKWWDDIWLNEGFASWMSSKPIEAWHPEWHIELNDVSDATRAMGADSLENTHPIKQQAETPAEILELADPEITYDKTSAVLRMVESYLGENTFRMGVNDYLKAHAYGNATSSDFWNALTKVSRKPVDKVMESFVDQPGVPIVIAKTECKASVEEVSFVQKRYFFDRAKFDSGNDELWHVPVCMKNGTSTRTAKCELVNEREQSASLSTCSPWVDINADAHGYYYSAYDPEMVQALSKNAEALSPAERIILLEDVWGGVRVDREKIGDYLALAEGLASDRTPQVIGKLEGELQFIDEHLVTDSDRDDFRSWVDKTFSPLSKEIGWEKRAGDNEAMQTLRGNLLKLLAGVAHDQPAETEARKIAEQSLANPSGVDAALASAALPLAAENGDQAFYDEVAEHMKKVTDPEQKYLYMQTLISFSDPNLLEKTLHFAVSSARSQDASFVIARVIRNPAGQKLGWDFVRSQWDSMKGANGAFGGGSSGAIVASTNSFCDPEMRDQVQSFFSAHPVPTAARTLKQSLEEIGYCIDMKSRQGAELSNWLHDSGGHAAK